MESTSGSVSIEASISLPIYIIVLMIFIYLLYMFQISDEISSLVSNSLLNSFESEYLTSKGDNVLLSLGENLLLKNKIEEEEKTFEKRINNFNACVESDDEFVNISCSYNFIMPFKLFDSGLISRKQIYSKRMFQGGMSLEDYKIVSKKIDAGFDVWSLENYERAKVISNLLGGTDSFNGNGIDKIENGRAVAIVSLDFRKSSYQEVEKVTDRVRDEIDKLVLFKNGYVAGEFVTENTYTKKVLELVIPDSDISPELEKEFLRIKNEANNKGVSLKITQIGGE